MKKNIKAPDKQGIVMHACPLARQGLLCFLTAQLPEFTFRLSPSFSDMGRLPELTQADLVVSDISDDERNAASGADWLQWLQNTRGEKPLVIVTEGLPEQKLFGLSRQLFMSVLALQTPVALMSQQLEMVLAGKQVISPLVSQQSILSAPRQELGRLTGTELQVFELLHAGYSVTQIADRLFRSVKTVSTHKRHLMCKMRVDNEIALFARVKNLNEKTCYLDNGQQFVRHLRHGAL